ncbi:MAG: hypothetical protein EXR81_04970 [Gammaproteobacteria bacterium]|nr:hypothetical protein [Gammaproteobacteria bacterium]
MLLFRNITLTRWPMLNPLSRFSEGRGLEQIGGSISKTSGAAGMALSAEGTVLEVEGYASSLSS